MQMLQGLYKMLQMLQYFKNVAKDFQNVANVAEPSNVAYVAYVKGFQRLEESVGQLQLCSEVIKTMCSLLCLFLNPLP